MKLRCFARCERRGECRGATKGSIAMQSRLTMIDRSRRHRLNASYQCCRLGEARPFRGAVFLRIRAADRACSPSESSIRFVSWSFRPQLASGGRGASPIYASHFRDAIYLNQAEAETLFRVCSANFNLTLFQFFSTNLRENSAGSSALINRK